MTGILLSLEILPIEQVNNKSEEHAANVSGVVTDIVPIRMGYSPHLFPS